MKFLPQDKKKSLRSGILLAISIAGIVYLNFFAAGETPAAPPPSPFASQPTLPPAPGQTAASQPGPVPVAAKQSGVLPYGPKIDLSILENEKFKALRAAAPLTVRPDELGKDNPFTR